MHFTVTVSLAILSIKPINGAFIGIADDMFENLNDRHTFWHCSSGVGFVKPCPAPLI